MWRCRTQDGPRARRLPTSLLFRWTRSPESRPSAIPRLTYRLCQASIPQSAAITNTRDLAPVPSWQRWISMMGHVTARVEDRHRSVEFIGLLSDLDAKYPSECTIRIILDNHSAHISKETQAFLSKHP